MGKARVRMESLSVGSRWSFWQTTVEVVAPPDEDGRVEIGQVGRMEQDGTMLVDARYFLTRAKPVAL